MLHLLEPEVAGGWGPGTEADVSVHPPVVSHLVYEVEGWLGDDLLEAFPCFVITERLADALRSTELTGWKLGPVEVRPSTQFEELNAGIALPKFQRLHVSASDAACDFNLDGEHRLLVSDAALTLLRRFNVAHCNIEAVG
ncbi:MULTISPECIES: hypothetical protein [Hydrogenophaga]|uniref:Uncharacterized protein n=1 Tax=Hydrogenophaga intermedia TaxID=65786 RepID=A0A1L1PGX7_HYDIT|nr:MULTISPECIES: hypothetical protein [Hydrogenophaga]AOS79898.1 hypothetical protein Q5W_13465 [Hydrogenophaga sp. PBC]TMU75490.1 hypothetical protein FGJ01_10210 [Hydrogenophaga intermedia]CDN88014.1 hypothetical protein BN948_02445 [Hydrogenophaga intermedia]